jgi:hypothetical protein
MQKKTKITTAPTSTSLKPVSILGRGPKKIETGPVGSKQSGLSVPELLNVPTVTSMKGQIAKNDKIVTKNNELPEKTDTALDSKKIPSITLTRPPITLGMASRIQPVRIINEKPVTVNKPIVSAPKVSSSVQQTTKNASSISIPPPKPISSKVPSAINSKSPQVPKVVNASQGVVKPVTKTDDMKAKTVINTKQAVQTVDLTGVKSIGVPRSIKALGKPINFNGKE